MLRPITLIASAAFVSLLFSGCLKQEDNSTSVIRLFISFKENGTPVEFKDGFGGLVDAPVNFNQQIQDINGDILICPNRGIQFFDPTFVNFQQITLQFANFCFNPSEFNENPRLKVLSMFNVGEYDMTNTSFGGNAGVMVNYVNGTGVFMTSQTGVPGDHFEITKTGYIPASATTTEKIMIEGTFSCTVTDGWSTTSTLTEGKFLMEVLL